MAKIDELTLAMLAKQRPTVGCWVRYKYGAVGLLCAECLQDCSRRERAYPNETVVGSSFLKLNPEGVFKRRKCAQCRRLVEPFNDERSRGRKPHGRTECPSGLSSSSTS